MSDEIEELRSMNLARPWLNCLTAELRQTALVNWDNFKVLSELLVELLFRKRRIAQELRNEIMLRLGELQSFPWPDTNVAPGGTPLPNSINWPKVGLLSFVGYRVGAKGVECDSRQDVLDAVYQAKLPNVDSPEYMKEWGTPITSSRLRKLANTIAAQVRNAKRRANSEGWQTSIEEWESDLEYLRRTYYVGRYDFSWPGTSV